MKPIIFGSLIAKLSKTPRIVNAFGGLGYLFTENSHSSLAVFSKSMPQTLKYSLINKIKSLKKKILRHLLPKVLQYLCSPPHVSLILQNQDDINTLLQTKCILPHWIDQNKVALIRGAGINTSHFSESPFPNYTAANSSPPLIIIACVSRMLRDKGILELIKAAKILQNKNICAQIHLYGDVDLENPASLRQSDLRDWHDQGIIVWHGFCEDVVKAYQSCHIAVLPSYREGFPKSLLEAASIGRPIVTTDVPGCREIVEHGENGLLVPAKDAKALADALAILCQDERLRIKMGKKSRHLVETLFRDSIIQQQTLALYKH